MDKQRQLDLLKRVAALHQDAPASAAGRLLLKLEPPQGQQPRQPSSSSLLLKPLPGLQAPKPPPGPSSDHKPASSTPAAAHGPCKRITAASKSCKPGGPAAEPTAGSSCKQENPALAPTAHCSLQHVALDKSSRLSLPPFKSLELGSTGAEGQVTAKWMLNAADEAQKPPCSSFKQTSLLQSLFAGSIAPGSTSRPPRPCPAEPRAARATVAAAAGALAPPAPRPQAAPRGKPRTTAAAAAKRKRSRQQAWEEEPDSAGADADVEDAEHEDDDDDGEGLADPMDLRRLQQLLQNKRCKPDLDLQQKPAPPPAATAAKPKAKAAKHRMSASSGSDAADGCTTAGSSGSDWQPSRSAKQAGPSKHFCRKRQSASAPAQPQEAQEKLQVAAKQSGITLLPLPVLKAAAKTHVLPMDADDDAPAERDTTRMLVSSLREIPWRDTGNGHAPVNLHVQQGFPHGFNEGRMMLHVVCGAPVVKRCCMSKS